MTTPSPVDPAVEALRKTDPEAAKRAVERLQRSYERMRKDPLLTLNRALEMERTREQLEKTGRP